MAEPTCSRCAELERRLLDLEAQLRELRAKLNTNSSNSSIPPSANPLGAEKPVKKKKAKNKRGAQPGHPPHLKQLVAPENVTRVVPIVPEQCEKCKTKLPSMAGANDPEPKRFQTIDLPAIVAEVVEYQAHGRTCPCCGEVTQAVIPAEIRAHSVGPRLTAAVAYLTGCHGVSKRGVEEIADALFGAPISLGTVSNLEKEVSEAVEPAHKEAINAIRESPVKYSDETSWKLAGKLCWLWAAATASVAAFFIHMKRSSAAFKEFLGDEIDGIMHSDRWNVYMKVPPERRQLCWSHLKRDFQKVFESGGSSKFVGRRGLRIVKEVFAAWHAFREGKLTRQELAAKMEPLQCRMNKALIEGAFGSDARVVRFCENVLNLESALWTFVTVEAVEPTNNHMERLLRRGVIWRRRSFGCSSQSGCRFVERVLTVVQTCRLRGKSALDYLEAAVRQRRNAQPAPSLLG